MAICLPFVMTDVQFFGRTAQRAAFLMNLLEASPGRQHDFHLRHQVLGLADALLELLDVLCRLSSSIETEDMRLTNLHRDKTGCLSKECD